MRAYTSSVASYGTHLPETPLSFPVSEITAESRESEMVIFATFQLPPNKTSINHVWQVGPLVGGRPLPHAMHGDSLAASGRVDFLSGSAQPAAKPKGLSRKEIIKYVHGGLCALGFGVMMPFGVLMARYKGFLNSGSPALWFKIHMFCQISAYIIGIIGFILGIVVGHTSKISSHGIIGIAIGCCTSIQVIMGFARPNKENKKRPIWNVCHYILGYGVIALAAANVFLGLGLLDLVHSWWNKSYMAYLIVFGVLWLLSLPLNWWHAKHIKNAQENMKNNASAC